jgi:hypothetical protein
MAWTAPRTYVAGELMTAAIGNVHWRDNLNALRAGGLSVTSQAANDLAYFSSSTQVGRVAAAASSVLITSAGSVPSLSQTLPTAVQDNITRLGTVTSGAFPAANLTGTTLAANVVTSSLTSHGTLLALAVANSGNVRGSITTTSNGGAASWQFAAPTTGAVAQKAVIGIGEFADDAWSFSTGSASFPGTERVRITITTGAFRVFNAATFDSSIVTVGPITLNAPAATNGVINIKAATSGGYAAYVSYWQDTLQKWQVGVGVAGGASYQWQNVTNGISAMALSEAGALTVPGFVTHTFGATGGSAVDVNMKLIGGDGSGHGPYLELVRNATTSGYIGTHSAVIGSTSSAVTIHGLLSDGVEIYASHASGTVKWFSGGTAERMRLFASGGLSVGDTTDPGATNFRVAGWIYGVLGKGAAFGWDGSQSAIAMVSDGGAIGGAPSYSGTHYLSVCQSANGTGAKTGNVISVGNNSSGNGAAGTMWFYGKGGSASIVWADASASPGKLRISTAAPEEDGTPSDTSGTVVGDQSSWHGTKRDIVKTQLDPAAALAAMVGTEIYDYRYTGTSYLDPDGNDATFTGVVGYDRRDWFLKNVGPQQDPCFNELTFAGYTVQAFKAVKVRQDWLTDEIADLRSLNVAVLARIAALELDRPCA